MSSFLIVAGAILQGVGLAVVFVEVAAIREHEFGEPAWWTRLARWLRSRLRRSPIVYTDTPTATIRFRGSAEEKMRPTALEGEVTDGERVAWLMRYVAALDNDIDQLRKGLIRERDAAIATAEQRDQELRGEIKATDERRRAQLRQSLRRQVIGAACIVLGLVLGTLGAVT